MSLFEVLKEQIKKHNHLNEYNCCGFSFSFYNLLINYVEFEKSTENHKKLIEMFPNCVFDSIAYLEFINLIILSNQNREIIYFYKNNLSNKAYIKYHKSQHNNFDCENTENIDLCEELKNEKYYINLFEFHFENGSDFDINIIPENKRTLKVCLKYLEFINCDFIPKHIYSEISEYYKK